jgi:hypothetical protein
MPPKMNFSNFPPMAGTGGFSKHRFLLKLKKRGQGLSSLEKPAMLLRPLYFVCEYHTRLSIIDF